MKKITTTLVLLFVLSVSIFADGEYPVGGKNCPQNQTCLTGNQTPIENPKEGSIFEKVLFYLKSIF